MSLPYKGDLIPLAKQLRKQATRQERRLWYNFLSEYPVRFQRQKTVGGYILDFYCHSVKLGIELDGSQHYTEQGVRADEERSAALEKYGVRVLRFSNYEIDRNFEGVCMQIDRVVKGFLAEKS